MRRGYFFCKLFPVPCVIKENMKVWKNNKGQLVQRSSGRGVKLYWSSAMIEKLKRLFPTTPNRELAAELGIGLSTLRNKARELDLWKDPDYLEETNRRKLRYGVLCSRLSPNRHKYRDGKIQEYIARETPEQRKRRIENGVRARKGTYRETARKGFETRKLWSEERKEAFREKMSQIRRKAIENGAVEKFKETMRRMPQALKEKRNRNISIGRRNAKVS